MATPYNKIYDRAMFRFRDYEFLHLTEYDRELILENHLKSAEADFVDICRYDLTKINDDLKEYEEDLDNETIDVLAAGVAYYWMSSKVLSEELFQNNLSLKESKDDPVFIYGQQTERMEGLNERHIRFYSRSDKSGV